MNTKSKQIPRRISHAKRKFNARAFDYSLNYKILDLRDEPFLYRVGVGEQGVLLVRPYKDEILPLWKFRTPADARASAHLILAKFEDYVANEDFVGMDMSRKFLQMGFTRSRRYANHRGGRKYDADGEILPYENDAEKAKSAEIFFDVWQSVEARADYQFLKAFWRARFG